SPTVNPDGSVTFHLHSPKTRKVILNGSFIPRKNNILFLNIFTSENKYVMKKNGDDFTYTTPPLKSEMYTYNFLIGDKSVLDPNNKNTLRDVDKYYNFFFVDGPLARYYIDQDIPHGKTDTIWYPSTMNGMSQRRMIVYTPAEYNVKTNKTFPVLYLLHGSGGDETTWANCGRACQILDNLIHEKKIQPVIVVMPNGNVELDAAPGESPYMNKKPSANNITSMLGKFEADFVNEIVKFTDKNYRTIPDKEHRAIAGLSLGGLHTLFITLNNPNTFDFIGLFSAQTTNMLDNNKIVNMERAKHNLQRIKNIFAIIQDKVPEPLVISDRLEKIHIYKDFDKKLKYQLASHPKLYYIAIGEDDFLYKYNEQFMVKLDSCNFKYDFHKTDGGHTWENWRKYLMDFLQKISWPVH
ncbi:MAG: hypothetical protein K6E54_09310, partial [Bacteroidaceae bacterium]|nr:hypothetical protein [Bacteroidaceae bacterium]